MKKLLLLTSALVIGVLAVAQCVHTLPSTVLVKKTDGQHIGTGDILWICEGRAIEINGESTVAYIEKDGDIWITGDNQTAIYMKAPGALLIDGDNGIFEVDSGVAVTDNGSNNNITICNQSVQTMKFDYQNVTSVTDCIDTTKVGLETVKKPSDVTLYPNPASDILNVTFRQNGGPATYQIYSMSGQVIQTGVLEINPGKIDVSALDKGLYFIEFGNKSGKLSKRFSVE